VRALLPIPPARAEVMLVRFHRVTEAMVVGVVVASLSQGALVGIALWGFGLPQPLLWGAVTCVVSLLPIFGSALVWLPAAGVLFAQDRPGAAAVLAAYGVLLVSNVDNALRLVVYSRVSHIPPWSRWSGRLPG
jgi:predicted PurR-regulated permease PerM